MQTKAATLHFNAVKTCFIALPKTLTSLTFARDKGSIFQLQSDTASLFVSWSGDVTMVPPGGQDEDIVELNGLMANKAGFRHGQQVMLTAVPATVVPSCESLFLEPLSVDDWEILELNTSTVENRLLDQVRVVAAGQIFPIWIQGSMCIFVRIGQLSVTAKCVLLERRTQLVVSRKVRHHRPFVPPGGVPEESNQSKHHVTSNLENVSKAGGENSVALGNSATESSSVKPEGIIARCFNYIKSFNIGEQSTGQQVEPPVQDPFIDRIRPGNLSDDFEITLRVQPIIEPDCVIESCPSPRQPEDNSEEQRKDEFIWQMANVRIGIETLAQCCDLKFDVGAIPAFPAILSKLPSPSDKEMVMKEHLSRSRVKLARNENEAARNKLDAETDNNMENKIVVRVMVVNTDNSCTVLPGNSRVVFNARPIVGHVMVSESLRQQLGAGITSRVRLTPLNCDPLEVKSVQLCPLFKTPDDINGQLVEMSFRAWLSRVTDQHCPLVVNQGTLIKFFIKPGCIGDYVMSFTPPSGAKVKVSEGHGHEGCGQSNYCLLAHDGCDHLKVTIDQADDEKIGRHVLTRLGRSGQCDPVLPQESLLQFGSVDSLVDQLLDTMTLALTQTPLSQKLSKCHISSHPVHRVLVCGSKGTGKSHMTRAVCRKLAAMPALAYISVVDCRALKGKRIESIHQHLGRVVTEAIWRSPSVILLDDLDHLVNEASSPEQEMNGEAQYSAHVSQVLQDLLGFDKLCGASIGVIATSQSRTSIHPTLVAASGRHFFQEIIQLDPPTEGQRSIILQCLLTRKTVVVPSCVRDLDLAAMAAKTEGFVARDLEYIVSRAIHANLMAKASVEASPEEGKKRNSEELQLADADFDQALIGYTPASLRNVPLHQPGEVGWENIGGLTSVKKTLIETLQWPAKYPKLFAACPLRLRSGLLLYGPSGTGKTLLAAAVAKECHLHFIHIKGPELLSKYIGASEQAVRDMFTRAHSARPCALFFDEFDSLAPRRGHDSTGVTDRVVNQLLTQLDGVEGLEGVYVLAATSRPDLIDPALLRPGRLDKLLYCGIPNQEDRFDILHVLTRNLQMATDVDLSALSEMCINFTGADLKALLYNAQLEAIHEMMDIAVPGMMGRVIELADSLDEVSHGSDVNIGAVVAQQPQKQVFVMETRCAHIPALQDGVVEPSGVTIDRLQQEVRHHMTQWSDKLTNRPARKRNVSMAIEIQQKHLLKAASEMVPSVPPSERAKYKMIYDAFVAGKGGNFQHDLTSAGKRATLA